MLEHRADRAARDAGIIETRRQYRHGSAIARMPARQQRSGCRQERVIKVTDRVHGTGL
jgi:hypothetical protein